MRRNQNPNPEKYVTIKEARDIALKRGIELSMYQVRYMARTREGLGKQLSKWGRWYINKNKWEELLNAAV